jgi:hypothetical protein
MLHFVISGTILQEMQGKQVYQQIANNARNGSCEECCRSQPAASAKPSTRPPKVHAGRHGLLGAQTPHGVLDLLCLTLRAAALLAIICSGAQHQISISRVLISE